jgi:hypothetical protein
MNEENLTRSIDNIIIEVVTCEGDDFVEITRQSISGPGKTIRFLKGNEKAACAFLSMISELMGVGPVTPDIEAKKDKKK